MTSASPERARPVLLVGSVPLDSARSVFIAVASSLGPLVKRIPDGETGDRLRWIIWQRDIVAQAKGIEVGGERLSQGGTIRNVQYRLVNPDAPEDVDFGALGYAENALASYAEFKRLRAQGHIAAGTRFQVSLPTPLAVVFAFFIPAAMRAVWPIYERHLLDEVDAIVAAIPHEDLAIQWDVAVEIDQILEVPQVAPLYPIGELVTAIARLADHVPASVELGLHFCYGDPGHKHIIEPKDTGLMVDLANRLGAAIRRPIGWMHMPVPRDRDDDPYFAPLRDLKLKPGTEFYLGLVHITDGIDGARRRVDAAQKVLPAFGIATECGFGRRPVETIPALLQLHKEIAQL
jgi:hypothetical protein